MVKQSNDTPAKPAKRYAPTRLEVVKTVIIAVLIASIAAFIAGTRYANSRHATLDNAVSEARAQAIAELEPAPKK